MASRLVNLRYPLRNINRQKKLVQVSNNVTLNRPLTFDYRTIEILLQISFGK